MQTVFKKLNLKEEDSLLVLNAPASFSPELEAIQALHAIHSKLDELEEILFALLFIQQKEEVAPLMSKLQAKLKGDVSLWFAYPKKSSKKYKSNISRDAGWEALGENQFEAVRMVAIDEDWSAIRFRKVDFIKNMTRDPKRKLVK